MSQQTDSRIEELKTKLVERDQLKQTLIQAQETMANKLYRLDAIETYFDRLQDEISNLESASLAGLLSSIMGTKAGKLDSLRQESNSLELEHRECDQAVIDLKRQVDALTAQLADYAEVEAEYKALRAADPNDTSEEIHRIEQVIDAGESLITLLSGAYGICHRMRRGPSMLQSGALLSTTTHAWSNKMAGGVTEQIADSVRHFCNQLSLLRLDPENPSDAETIDEWNRINRFNDPASLGVSATANDWAELETLAACIVTDLQDRLGNLKKACA